MSASKHDCHCITQRAIELALIGFSASDATALAVMGRHLTATAVQRVEAIVSAVLARRLRRAA